MSIKTFRVMFFYVKSVNGQCGMFWCQVWKLNVVYPFNPFATENVDIRFEGLALTPDVRKNTFFSKKPSQTINIVTSVIFMVEWKVNQFWNAQDFADSKLVYFSFYHKKYGSCDFFNKTSCFKKRRFTSV